MALQQELVQARRDAAEAERRAMQVTPKEPWLKRKEP